MALVITPASTATICDKKTNDTTQIRQEKQTFSTKISIKKSLISNVGNNNFSAPKEIELQLILS